MQIFTLAALLTFAGCASTQKQSACIDESKINPDAVCLQVYEPVCGCDNKTYGNDCEARKNGVTQWTKGECGK